MNIETRPTALRPFTNGRPPHLPCGPGDISADVLLPGDPLRAKWIAETFFDEARQVNGLSQQNIPTPQQAQHPNQYTAPNCRHGLSPVTPMESARLLMEHGQDFGTAVPSDSASFARSSSS